MTDAIPFVIVVCMLVAIFMLVGAAVYLFSVRHNNVNTKLDHIDTGIHQKLDKLDARGELLHNDVVESNRSMERMHESHKEVQRICEKIKEDTGHGKAPAHAPTS